LSFLTNKGCREIVLKTLRVPRTKKRLKNTDIQRRRKLPMKENTDLHLTSQTFQNIKKESDVVGSVEIIIKHGIKTKLNLLNAI
jgi:hypothetical protein